VVPYPTSSSSHIARQHRATGRIVGVRRDHRTENGKIPSGIRGVSGTRDKDTGSTLSSLSEVKGSPGNSCGTRDVNALRHYSFSFSARSPSLGGKNWRETHMISAREFNGDARASHPEKDKRKKRFARTSREFLLGSKISLTFVNVRKCS